MAETNQVGVPDYTGQTSIAEVHVEPGPSVSGTTGLPKGQQVMQLAEALAITTVIDLLRSIDHRLSVMEEHVQGWPSD
jgi:hypothetical protein